MNCVHIILFVIGSVLINSVQSHPDKMCDLANITCTTRAFQNLFKSSGSGIQAKVKTFDPMHLKEVKGRLPRLNYIFSNCTITGMRNCQVMLFRVHVEKSAYEYDLICPKLIHQHHYWFKGQYGPVEIDGEGQSTVILNNYIINLKGDYSLNFGHKDNDIHLNFKTFYPEFLARGKHEFNFQGSFHKDAKKSELAKVYLNENRHDMEGIIRSPVMEEFMKDFLVSANFNLNLNPVTELLSD